MRGHCAAYRADGTANQCARQGAATGDGGDASSGAGTQQATLGGAVTGAVAATRQGQSEAG